MSTKQQTIIGLKELRENVMDYIKQIQKGKSFIVVRRSQPVFRITPVEEDSLWESVVDFTKISKGGVNIKEILSRI